MNKVVLTIPTSGEKFYSITDEINAGVQKLQENNPNKEIGAVLLFCRHTSCALTINESFDPSARVDMENFLKNLAPRNLAFITHTAEGEDDSPSHMKSILLQSSIVVPVEKAKLDIGTWQGIYLAEFRDSKHTRQIEIKII